MGRQFCYGKEIIFLQGSFSMEKEFLFGEGSSIMDFFIMRRKFFKKKVLSWEGSSTMEQVLLWEGNSTMEKHFHWEKEDLLWKNNFFMK